MAGSQVVGVDLDGHDGLTLLISYLRCLSCGRVSVLYSRRGFHLIVEDIRYEIGEAGALGVRRWLLDDPARVDFDERRIRSGLVEWVDTLFDMKRAPDGSWYRCWEFDPLAVMDPLMERPVWTGGA